MQTCEMFENNTRTTEVEGENFGTTLTMMAKGCKYLKKLSSGEFRRRLKIRLCVAPLKVLNC